MNRGLVWFFLFLGYARLLSADLEEYFKPITNRSGQHSMPGIDFIYMINLDKRPEKYALCMEKLSPYGIEPFRFSAVNGWELPLEVINAVGMKYASWMPSGRWATCYLPENGGRPQDEPMHVPGRAYFYRSVAPGAIGCVLSHLSVLQDAYDAGYETIWIMEDDIEIFRDPRILSDLIEKLDQLVGKDGWDILFTDRDTKGQDGKYVPCLSYAIRPNYIPHDPLRFAKREAISEEFRHVGARYGSYSMIVRKSGMKKILDFLKFYEIFLPYDMEYTLPPDIRLYTVLEDVVSTQPQAPTDNGAPNYNH